MMTVNTKYIIYARVDDDILYEIGDNICIDFLYTPDYHTYYGWEIRLEGNVQDKTFQNCMDLFNNTITSLIIEGKRIGDDFYLSFTEKGSKITRYSISVSDNRYSILFQLIK